MLNTKNIAVVGPTGMVGKELLTLLKNRDVKTFSRESNLDFESSDLIFFCTGSDVSKKLIPIALNSGAQVIDLSSAFREDPNIPLVIPEINGHLLEKEPQLISSPNCTASIMLMALFPLHKLFGLRRIILSSYQAVSGAGRKATEALLSREHPLDLHLHPGDEEKKVTFEVRKILELPELAVSATCVRVPVVRAHSISLFAEFASPIDEEAARRALQKQNGVALANKTPAAASNQHDIFVGRVRKENSNSLHLWVVGDQLLKGAALNAFQIAQNLSTTYNKKV
ncbi:MAG: aspartate-semialdehyde dehydrogenase [Chlamydiales bacterium]